MTCDFLTGKSHKRGRPAEIDRILENIKRVAPAHSKLLSEYIDQLELLAREESDD